MENNTVLYHWKSFLYKNFIAETESEIEGSGFPGKLN